MKRRIAFLASVLIVSTLLNTQCIEVYRSNPISEFVKNFPGLDILSPAPYGSYQNTTVQVNLQLRLAKANNSMGYSPEIVHVCYRLDDGNNITIPNIPESRIEYLLGEFPFVRILINSTLYNLAEGPHTLRAYSFDKKGEGMSNFVEFKVDTRKIPNISIISPQNTVNPKNEIPLIFFTDEACQNLSYRLDNHNPVHIDGNTTLTGLINGSHTIFIRGNNSVGRFGQSNDTYFTVNLQDRDLLADELIKTTLAIPIVVVIIVVAITSVLLVYFRRRRGKP